MRELTFTLQPFKKTENPQLKIEGKAVFNYPSFEIYYTLSGEIESIAIPSQKPEGERRYLLWETTCFEFFLSIKDSPRYWEFNLSPSGDWNVYRFEDYRQGMAEEGEILRLPFAVQTGNNKVSLRLQFDLTPIVGEDEALEIAIATVIQTQSGEISYWALNHCGAEADFHHRDSFV